MTNQIEIKVLMDLGRASAGDVVKLDADKDGTPYDSFWRRRIKDSEVDRCCEVVKKDTDKTTKAKTKK